MRGFVPYGTAALAALLLAALLHTADPDVGDASGLLKPGNVLSVIVWATLPFVIMVGLIELARSVGSILAAGGCLAAGLTLAVVLQLVSTPWPGGPEFISRALRSGLFLAAFLTAGSVLPLAVSNARRDAP